MFLKNFIFINVLFLLVFDLSAQSLDSLAPEVETTVVYGSHEKDEFGSAIEEVPGGYIICGKTRPLSSDSSDVYLIRTNGLNVSPRRTKTFGGIGDDCAYSLQITDDGGYIICGYTDSYGSGGTDVYLIKTDSLGDTLWTKTFGGTDDDCGYSVETTSDGGYIICGYTESFGAGGRDVYLIKTNSSGDLLWAKTFGGAGTDWGASVKQTKDEGYIITGETSFDQESSTDIYLLKIDSIGDTLWTRSYGDGLGWDGGSSVIEASDGGYVIAGSWQWPIGMASAYLLKTDSQGDSLWSYIGDGGIWESVIETKNHDYVVTGVTWGSLTSLAKVNPAGDLLWSNYIGEDFDWTSGESIRQTTDGGYVAVGTCENYEGYDDSYNIFVVKIAPDEAGVLEKNAGEKDIILSCEPIVFSSVTEILYSVKSENTDVEIAVFGVSGERLKTIFSETRTKGQYKTSWDGTADDGHLLPNGVYFLRVATENRASSIKKLVLLR